MDQKKTAANNTRKYHQLKKRLQLVKEEVEQEIEMKRKTYAKQSISKEEESSVAKLVAEFRRKQLNATTETTQATTNNNNANMFINEDPSNPNYNTINAFPSHITTLKESHTQNSQLSVAPLPSLADRQNKNSNPAFSVADVTFSTDESLLSTARDISGHLIQYDNDKVINSLIVNVQTASLAPLLNPDTKEIAKIESNKIQQVETKRWNTSAKK